MKSSITIVLLLVFAGFFANAVFAAPKIDLLDVGIHSKNVALIINANDALSKEIAKYYQKRHGVPDEHLFYIQLSTKSNQVSVGEFAVMKRLLDAQLPDTIQALILTWATPYRVDCMSITSAFTFGFNQQYCATGCKLTARSRYFNSSSRAPFTDHGIRPAISLAANTLEEAKKLIDRGVLAKNHTDTARALLVSTSDNARNVRSQIFQRIKDNAPQRLDVEIIEADVVNGKRDVMFYFTGLSVVEGIEDNNYLPGAIADHLTSFGGRLVDSSQMSAMKWLESGVTGSYGTVVEPCAFPGKFPNPQVVINKYLAGESLLEAYWKSVSMPGQGIFIGDPLAKPFRDYDLIEIDNGYRLVSPYLKPGTYQLLGKETRKDPYKIVTPEVNVTGTKKIIEIIEPILNYYQLKYLPSEN